MEKYKNDLWPKGKIAISVAYNKDIYSLSINKVQFERFIIELSRRLLDVGAKMIHGGKMEKGGFTERFRSLANHYGQELKAEKDEYYFTNYLAWPYYNEMSNAEYTEYQSSRMKLMKVKPSEFVNEDMRDTFIKPLDDNSRFLYATSMTAMRKQAESNSNARIIIGGKTSGFSGCMPGIMEEFLIALEYHHPVYLIGGFGGASKIITQIIEKVDGVTSATLREKTMATPNYSSLCEYYAEKGMPVDYTVLDGIKIEDLDNGLSVEQNLRLFHSLDIEEIESLVLLGLKTKDCI